MSLVYPFPRSVGRYPIPRLPSPRFWPTAGDGGGGDGGGSLPAYGSLITAYSWGLASYGAGDLPGTPGDWPALTGPDLTLDEGDYLTGTLTSNIADEAIGSELVDSAVAPVTGDEPNWSAVDAGLATANGVHVRLIYPSVVLPAGNVTLLEYGSISGDGLHIFLNNVSGRVYARSYVGGSLVFSSFAESGVSAGQALLVDVSLRSNGSNSAILVCANGVTQAGASPTGYVGLDGEISVNRSSLYIGTESDLLFVGVREDETFTDSDHAAAWAEV